MTKDSPLSLVFWPSENIDQALKDGPQNVERTTENVVRLIAKK